jgi:hypothetical protein
MPNAIVDFLKDLGLQIVIKRDSVGIQIGGNQKPLAEQQLPETDDSELMTDDDEPRRDTIPVQGQVIDLPSNPPNAAHKRSSQGK